MGNCTSPSGDLPSTLAVWSRTPTRYTSSIKAALYFLTNGMAVRASQYSQSGPHLSASAHYQNHISIAKFAKNCALHTDFRSSRTLCCSRAKVFALPHTLLCADMSYGRTTKCAGKIRRDARTAVDAHCPDTMQSLDDPPSQRIIHAPQERKVCSKLAA